MYNPTQNLANQLANPYTYSTSGNSSGASGLIKGDNPIQQGWGDVTFQDPTPAPEPAPAPTTPAPAGLITGGTDGSSGNGSRDTPATPIAGTTTPPPKASATTTVNGNFAVPNPALAVPPKIEGVENGGKTQEDPTGVLSNIGLKSSVIESAKVNGVVDQNTIRELGKDPNNYDVEGFLASNAGKSWSQIGTTALTGGLSGGVVGAAIAGLISYYSGKNAVVDPSQANNLRGAIAQALKNQPAAQDAPAATNTPVRVTEPDGSGYDLTLPDPYQSSTAEDIYSGYLGLVNTNNGNGYDFFSLANSDPVSVTDTESEPKSNATPYGSYLSSVNRVGGSFSANGGIAGGNSERGDSW